MDRISGGIELTAPVSVNEIAHAWDKVREAQKEAITGNLKLIQTTLDFGKALIRAEHQMGFDNLMAELSERGIEEHTAKSAMRAAKDNPNGVTDVASDPKKAQALLQSMLFPAPEAKPSTGEADSPAWQWTKQGFVINENPENWTGKYSKEDFRRQTEPMARLWVEFGWARLTA